MSPQADAEAKCQKIYREAQTFFDQIPHPRYYGFKILNAPPLFQPRVLFVGYQPAGGDNEFEWETARGSDKHWPPKCEYATENWKLAKQMRRMFEQKFLEQCVGTNAIFLRFPSVDDYKRTYNKNRREEIERFCLDRVDRIIEAIDPQKIVAIGFGTLKLFGASVNDITNEKMNEKRRTLTRKGKIANRTAIATLHLSGAHISNFDLNRIRDRILAR